MRTLILAVALTLGATAGAAACTVYGNESPTSQSYQNCVQLERQRRNLERLRTDQQIENYWVQQQIEGIYRGQRVVPPRGYDGSLPFRY